MEKLVVESDGPRGADPQCREPQSPGEVAGTVAQPVPQATVLTPALQAPRLSLGTAAQGWGLSILEELPRAGGCPSWKSWATVSTVGAVFTEQRG